MVSLRGNVSAVLPDTVQATRDHPQVHPVKPVTTNQRRKESVTVLQKRFQNGYVTAACAAAWEQTLQFMQATDTVDSHWRCSLKGGYRPQLSFTPKDDFALFTVDIAGILYSLALAARYPSRIFQ